MATERILLTDSSWLSPKAKPTREVAAEYVEVVHWATGDPRMKAYEVIVDGNKVGKIERALESTDRIYGRIRSPGKGRLAWAWKRYGAKWKPGVSDNYPGSYERNRAAAVARILGYSSGEKV